MTSIIGESLLDRKQLIELYPALGARKYRLDHLIRTRQIPIFKLGRSIYFNPREIDKWIKDNQIKSGGRK